MHIRTDGEGWSTQVNYCFFRWDDVIERERNRTWLSRLPLGIASCADFIVHGALWGYLRNSWRYVLFFLYPFLALALLAAAAWTIASAGTAALGLSRSPALGTFLTLAGIAVLLPLAGNRMYLDHLLDDWIHAMRLVRAPDPVVAQRIEGIAGALKTGLGDELLIFGHSLGAVHAVELIDQLIADDPHGPLIRFATAGSSILKIGLHKKAAWLHQAIQRIANSPRVIWVDFQALNDVMNFYKSDPVAALGLTAPPVQTRIVRFRAGVVPDRYRRMERNFFRLHNQFVHANDLRARYDFVMTLAGPFPLETLSHSDEGAMPWIGGDGALTKAGRTALTGIDPP